MPKSYLFVAFLIFGLLSACRPDQPVIPEAEKTIWQEHPQIVLDQKIVLSLAPTKERLLIGGNNYFLSLDGSHKLEQQFLVSKTGNNLSYKPFLSENIIAWCQPEDTTIELRLSNNPAISHRINLFENSADFGAIRFYYNAPLAINSANQLFVPIASRKSNNLYFMVYQLNFSSNKITSEFLNVHYISLQEGIVYNDPPEVTSLYAEGEEVYFTNNKNGRFYKVDASGNYKDLFQMKYAYKLPLKDTLAFIGFDFNWYLNIFKKPVGTENWEGYNLNISDNGFMRFTVVDNEIIAYRGGQLWRFKMLEGNRKIEVKEIDNEGIGNVQIKDIVEFKGKVYIATLTGLYYKPLNEFFRFKN